MMRNRTVNVKNAVGGSFRDPSGSVFLDAGRVFRNINYYYKNNFDLLISSGLHQSLVQSKLLIPHRTLPPPPGNSGVYKILQPDIIPFISYPFEWCFSQLKDAALLTLAINLQSLKHGMVLKDASAYNVQFLNAKPIFIDTLSFDRYHEGEPWIAYQQFCRHFLAPLLLASYLDPRLIWLSRNFIDGIPLDLVSKVLPLKSYLSFSVLSHLHFHSKVQSSMDAKLAKRKVPHLPKNSLLSLLTSLVDFISSLKLGTEKSEWADYYSANNYTPSSFKDKQRIIHGFISGVSGVHSVWDLGSNTGLFTRALGLHSANIVNMDYDILATEKDYREVSEQRLPHILPLCIDLTNPSPAIGWANEERASLVSRGPCDLALALALIHHLAITNNLPFSKIAQFLNKICHNLIIEFVPKNDSQVVAMLQNREDIFDNYTQEKFETEFSKYFSVKQRVRIQNSERFMYLMLRK